MEKFLDLLKKNRISVIVIFIILLVAYPIGCQIMKYRFGYFIDGPDMLYEHDGDVLRLDDGNILILGSNRHESPYKDRWSMSDLKIMETPSEIYNVSENKFEKFDMPTNIVYWPYGILLKNNKLLLTFAYDPNGSIKYTEYSTNGRRVAPFPYDSMAIVDLKTRKVEKMCRKKINLKNEPFRSISKFTLLGNGKVLIIDFNTNLAEIYNPETNTSKLLDVKIDKFAYSSVVAYGDNKALIFGDTKKLVGNLKDTVEEYDDTTETIKVVGEVLKRSQGEVVKVSSDKVIIMGGSKHENEQKVEIYDMQSNEVKFEPKMHTLRSFGGSSTSFIGAPLNDRYFLITGGIHRRFLGYSYEESAEMLDLHNGKIYEIPDMKKRFAFHKMIKIGDNLMVLDNRKSFPVTNSRRRTQIFKKWRWIK